MCSEDLESKLITGMTTGTLPSPGRRVKKALEDVVVGAGVRLSNLRFRVLIWHLVCMFIGFVPYVYVPIYTYMFI